MIEHKDKGGRPRLTEKQKSKRKEYLLSKLEPYLMTGISVNKALREAKVFNSEFYRYMAEDRFFGEKVAKFRQYISVLVNKIIVTELFRIIEKQNNKELLLNEDVKFLMWFGTHANVCRDEWGRSEVIIEVDPEEEIERLKNLIQTN